MNVVVKNRVIWGFLGLAAGVLITNAAVALTVRRSVVQEYLSPDDLTTTVQKIVVSAVDRGWSVSGLQPLSEDAAQPGGPHPWVHILEITNPGYARDLVAFSRNRTVAMAPTTLVVYEEAGQVYVARINTGLIGRFFRRDAAGPMQRKRHDEGEILSFLAKR
jgi:uncharacterized protein (DUF302 family)